jgi:hypothetical protein
MVPLWSYLVDPGKSQKRRHFAGLVLVVPVIIYKIKYVVLIRRESLGSKWDSGTSRTSGPSGTSPAGPKTAMRLRVSGGSKVATPGERSERRAPQAPPRCLRRRGWPKDFLAYPGSGAGRPHGTATYADQNTARHVVRAKASTAPTEQYVIPSHLGRSAVR